MDLSGLNPKQRDAVLHTDGPLVILAGAGSGKTRVITHRIAHLLKSVDVPGRNILAVSFTNKAADEMRQRVAALVPPGIGKGLTISTFHALAVRILREEIHHLGYKNNFTILDASEQLSILKKEMKDIKIDDRKFKAEWILANISRAKNAFTEPQVEHGDDYEIMTAAAYTRYQEALRAFNALDFDDLIRLSVILLSKHETVRDKFRERYRYLMIDEYQDTNAAQYRLTKLLGGGHRNVCVVGDDDQSIYGWRGGEVGNILRFADDFPGTKTVTLDQNYRSTQRILSAANAVIRQNPDRKPKNLWSERGEGEPILLIEAEDENEEGRIVAERILAFKLSHQAQFEHFGVLTRTNQQSRAIEEAFRLNRIPYELIGGLRFYDRKEIKDLLAYLRLLVNPDDEISLLRILNYPARGIGRTTAIKLADQARESGEGIETVLRRSSASNELSARTRDGVESLLAFFDGRRPKAAAHPPSETAREALDALKFRETIREEESDPQGAERRIENLEELIAGIRSYEQTTDQASLSDYLDKICLMTSTDTDRKKNGQGVRLMTIHSAKGLEFPFVFLPGVEEEFIPHKRSTEAAATLHEERRLFYVAITRAQKQLVITYAKTRHRFQKDVPRLPSRFLREIPDDLLEKESALGARPVSPDQEEKLAKDFFGSMRRLLDN